MTEEKKVGYAISLIMDYGNGRQVQISGNLPVGATKEEFDAELDKLRLSTNRQQAFIIMRDREARLIAEKKMVQALEVMVKEYELGMDEEVKRLSSGPKAGHTNTQQALANMQAQLANYKQLKREELQRHQADVEICEVIIASTKKEIEG